MIIRNSLRFTVIISCLFIPWALGGLVAESTNDPIIGVSVGLVSFGIGMIISLRLVKKWFN